MNSISGASLAVNQEYVNENVDKIVEFMGICTINNLYI